MRHYTAFTILRHAALIVAILAASIASAQRKDYDLERDFGLTALQGKLTLSSIPDRLTKVPKVYERLRGLGWTDAKIARMNVGPAYHLEAVLQGQGGGQPITGRITSNNGVTWPAGTYDVNYPCIMDGGDYIGKGTGYAGTNPVSMNTTLVLNRADWLGTEFDQMNLMQTSTWGMLTGSNSYTESGSATGFRLTGDNPGWHNAAYMSSGLGLWDIGENWRVGTFFAEHFNGYGVTLVRGTPAAVEYISAFQNSMGGVGIIGGALNTYAFGVLSGDDNPAMIVMRPGYGREGGGRLYADLVKSESGKRTPIKGQIVLDAIGYVSAAFGNVWMACDYERVDAAFVVDSRGVGSIVSVQAFSGYGYHTVLQDIGNRKRWASPQEYAPISFTWISTGGGQMQSLPALTASTHSCLSRLGTSKFVNGAWQVFNYTNCTPSYLIAGTNPLPPSCTWVLGTQACAPCNGTAIVCTTPYVSSASGCVPTAAKPADQVISTPCTVTPPPASDVIASFDNYSNTSPTASMAVDWKAIKRVRFVNVKLSAMNSHRLLYASATDNNGLRIRSDGKWVTPSGQVCTSTPATWAVNTTYANAEIVLPATMDAAFFLARPGVGSALLFSADRIEFLR